MKKVINYLMISALVIGAVSFNSCKKDDHDDLIVGTWKITKVTGYEVINGRQNVYKNVFLQNK